VLLFYNENYVQYVDETTKKVKIYILCLQKVSIPVYNTPLNIPNVHSKKMQNVFQKRTISHLFLCFLLKGSVLHVFAFTYDPTSFSSLSGNIPIFYSALSSGN